VRGGREGFLFFFWGVSAIQLAHQLQQERTQLVCSNREAWKCPARGHPGAAMDIGLEDMRTFCSYFRRPNLKSLDHADGGHPIRHAGPDPRTCPHGGPEHYLVHGRPERKFSSISFFGFPKSLLFCFLDVAGSKSAKLDPQNKVRRRDILLEQLLHSSAASPESGPLMSLDEENSQHSSEPRNVFLEDVKALWNGIFPPSSKSSTLGPAPRDYARVEYPKYEQPREYAWEVDRRSPEVRRVEPHEMRILGERVLEQPRYQYAAYSIEQVAVPTSRANHKAVDRERIHTPQRDRRASPLSRQPRSDSTLGFRNHDHTLYAESSSKRQVQTISVATPVSPTPVHQIRRSPSPQVVQGAPPQVIEVERIVEKVTPASEHQNLSSLFLPD